MKRLRQPTRMILAVAVTIVALLAATVVIPRKPGLLRKGAEPEQKAEVPGSPKPETANTPGKRADEILALAQTKAAKGEWDLIDAVTELGDTLTQEEAAEIVKKLREIAGKPDAGKISAVNLNSLLNLLRRNGVADPDIFQSLAGIVANEAADIEVRDYAVQHAEGWLRERDPATGKPAVDDPPSRQAIRKLLVDAAAMPGKSFSGTATTALVDLAGFYPEEFPAELVDRSVLGLLKGDEVHPAARVSAIQLCAERGLTQALPEIRAVMGKADAAPALRLAAYAALGTLGDASDAAALDKLLATEVRDRRFDAALQGARKKIAARIAPVTK